MFSSWIVVRVKITSNCHNVVVVQSPSCVWLHNLMDCSTPGLPVSHYLLEFAQVHVHCIGDAIQPSPPPTPCFTVQFSCSIMSDSLWPHGLQHATPPWPSLSPGVCPSSCSLYRWCHPVISPSDALFSSCPQSLPAKYKDMIVPLYQTLHCGTSVSLV